MSRKFLTPIVLPADPAAAMEAATKQYVDGKAGGGTDEVWIGPTDPIATSPSIELWYDDDAVATLNGDMRWYTAWGLIAIGTPQTTSVAYPGTNIPITPALTFQTVVGRRYRATLRIASATFTAGTATTLAVTIRSGTSGGASIGDSDQWLHVPGSYSGAVCTQYFTGDGTSKTAQGITETVSASGTTVSLGAAPLTIEDVGPADGTNVAPQEADLRWFSAWGIVATGTFAYADGAPLTTSTALTNQITYRTIVGRRYRIYMTIRAVSNATSFGYWFYLRTDGVVGTDRHRQVIGGQNYNQMDGEFIVVGDGNSHTFDMYYAGPTGPVAYTNGGLFYIEDVGPVTGAAIIPQVAVTPWTTVTYQNGWATWDTSGDRPAQYRKVGDVVELRGVIKAGTLTWGTAAFTLPVGFRPANFSMSFLINTMGGGASCDVFSDGRVSISGVPNVAIPAGSWVYIDPVRFSVTL